MILPPSPSSKEVQEFLCFELGLEELKALCSDLGIDYDSLAGQSKDEKVHELISWVEAHGMYGRLLDELNRRHSKTTPQQHSGVSLGRGNMFSGLQVDQIAGRDIAHTPREQSEETSTSKVDFGQDNVFVDAEIRGVAGRDIIGPCSQAKEEQARPLRPEVHIDLLTEIVPTAYCHNLTVNDFPLVQCKLGNVEPRQDNAQVRVEAYIEDYSDRAIQSVPLASGTWQTIHLLPVLKKTAVRTLNEITPVTLRVRVHLVLNGSELIVYDQTKRVKLHALDTAVLAVRAPGGSIIDLTDHLAAFVTPHIPEIENLLRAAVEHHPDHRMVGYQGASTVAQGRQIVREQARAIFTAIKHDAGLAYVNSPINFGKQPEPVTQRVRLPNTSLHENRSRANCIDGTVLFASLLELAAISPVLVIVPGHAFVGWRVWAGVNQYEFVETTMIDSSDFDTAQQQGQAQYDHARMQGFFGRGLFDPAGFSRLIGVQACRMKGIEPLI